MLNFQSRVAYKAALATVIFATIQLVINLALFVLGTTPVGVGRLPILIGFVVYSAIAFGIYHGGFGWTAVMLLFAAAPAITLPALWKVYSLGFIDHTTILLRSIDAILGIYAAIYLGRATYLMWRYGSEVRDTKTHSAE